MRLLPFSLIAASLCYSLPINSYDHVTIKELIHIQAEQSNIPAPLLKALIKTESNFNPKAKRYEKHLDSHSIGLMQVMANYWVNSKTCPTIKHENDLLDPSKNLQCGTAIFSNLLDIYPSTEDALIAYNGGKGCFKKPKCLVQAKQYAKKVLNYETKS